MPFRLFLKREDLHPYGSHKGRSISYMMDQLTAKGFNKFALSSSGNAALAAAIHIAKLPNAELHIYCGLNIAERKIAKLKNIENSSGKISIHRVERPLQALKVHLERESDTASLRQSTDDNALLGYDSLVSELLTIPNLTDVFIGTSSGTTAMALAQGLPSTRINIVQTSSCHPIATALDASTPNQIEVAKQNDDKSLADAIVDKVALRSKTLIPLIKQNKGQAFIADNYAIAKAQELVVKYAGLRISANSALSIVGLTEMMYTECPTGDVVCMICGD